NGYAFRSFVSLPGSIAHDADLLSCLHPMSGGRPPRPSRRRMPLLRAFRHQGAWSHALRLRARGEGRDCDEGGWLEIQHPGLTYEVLPEGVVRFLLHELESGGLVDAACGDENVIGPERDRLVALRPREADALVDKPPSDAESPCGRLHIEQPELRYGVGFPDEKDRPHHLAIALRDPGGFAAGIELP